MAVVAAGLAAAPLPVDGCSCAEPPSDADKIATADVVAIIQPFRITPSGLMTAHVVESFRGGLHGLVEVETGFEVGSSCGEPTLPWPGGVMAVAGDLHGGRLTAGVCGVGVVAVDSVRAAFGETPWPTGQGPPGFAVGTGLGDMRTVLLDRRGSPLGLGPGAGHVVAYAWCPGGARLAEIVRPRVDLGMDDQPWRPMVAVRDVETMAVVSEIDVDMELPGDSSPIPIVRDAVCLDAEGAGVAFLAPGREYDRFRGSELISNGRVVLVVDSTVDFLDVGQAKSMAADPVTERMWTVNGIDGRELITWDLSNRTITDRGPLPGGAAGWYLTWNAELQELAVLSRSVPLDPQNWYYPDVDQLVRLTFDAESRVVPFRGSFAGTSLASLGTDGYSITGHSILVRVNPSDDIVTSRPSEMSIGSAGSEVFVSGASTLTVQTPEGVDLVSGVVDPQAIAPYPGLSPVGPERLDRLAVFEREVIDPPVEIPPPQPTAGIGSGGYLLGAGILLLIGLALRPARVNEGS